MVGKSEVAVYDGSLSEWLAEGGATTTGPEPGVLD